MKKLFILLLVVAFAMPAMAQEEETLIGGKIESGGYGGQLSSSDKSMVKMASS